MENTSLFYDIHLCRICQNPEQLDLVYTSTRSENGKSYMDLLKFIFNDIPWIEDNLISLACHICIKKINDAAEFKSICAETNSRRDAHHKVEDIKLEIQSEVDAAINDNGEPEIEAIMDGQTPEVGQLFLDEQNLTKNIELQEPKKSKRKKTIDKPQTRPKAKSTPILKSKPKEKKIEKPKGNQRISTRECDICLKTMKTLMDYDRHMNKHNGSRNYICTECGKTYITQDDLKQHSYRHSTEAIYPCSICNKNYRTTRHLRIHKKLVHSNKEDFKFTCSDCGTKFQQQAMLKWHVLHRHIKNRKFKCDMCGKGFVEKRSLQNHILTHTNVRPYRCDVCPAEYKQNSTLLRHKTKIHGIGNYKFPIKKFVACTFCGRTIGKDKLERHIRSHTGVKPFGCRLCFTKFSCKSYIKGHLKKKHKTNVDAFEFKLELYYEVIQEPATKNLDSDKTEAIREKSVAEAAPLSS